MPQITLHAILFYGFAALAVTGAVGVLLTRNIVRTAMWLLAALAAAAGFYFLLGAIFVGGIQLIVYAGGTLVLIVFGVMLTNKKLYVRLVPGRAELIVGAIVCVVLAGGLIALVVTSDWKSGPVVVARGHWQAEGLNNRPLIDDLKVVNNYLVANGVSLTNAEGRPWYRGELTHLAEIAYYARNEADGRTAKLLLDENDKLLPADALLKAVQDSATLRSRRIEIDRDAAPDLWAAVDSLKGTPAPNKTVHVVAWELGELDKLSDVDGADATANLGKGLLSTYLVPFEVISVLLLAVLVGAGYLARPKAPTPRKGGGDA